MIFLKFKINSILKSKILWVIPSFSFFLFFVLKIFNLININVHFISILTIFVYVLISFIFIIYLYLFNSLIFVDRDNFVNQSIYFFSLGFSLKIQFFYLVLTSLLCSTLCYLMLSTFYWTFSSKYFLISLILGLFLFNFRLLSYYLNLYILYFISLVLILSSLLFPVFIFPNVLYILKNSGIYSTLYYISYILFYIYIAYLMYSKMWREECIGQ